MNDQHPYRPAPGSQPWGRPWPASAHGVPPGPGDAGGSGAPPGPGDGRRRGWAAIGGAAATAALLASLGTAAFTGAFDDTAPAASPAVVQGPARPVAQVTETDWAAVTAAVQESVVALEVVTPSGAGVGSGVVLDAAGNILTNSHVVDGARSVTVTDRKSTRLNSSHVAISYAVFC